MKRSLKMTMWSSSSLDLKNMDLILEGGGNCLEYEPTPYTFTKLENGKKTTVDSSSISPPSWLLLDHTIAVVWSMFSLNPSASQLSMDDLKWGYEFLKEIRNKKGENPPDVKVCLKEIQDRLINLYARLTSLREEDFDEIAAAFGETIMSDSSNFLSPISPAKLDASSICSFLPPSKTILKMSLPGYSTKDLAVSKTNGNTKHQIAMNYSKKTFPFIEQDANMFEESENTEDEEVEKYLLSLFEDESKRDELQGARASSKSTVPAKRKPPRTLAFSEMISTRKSTSDVGKSDKASKKVHCVAEMRSLKFQKSMKVQDTNGEEAAYSNLKAEIRRLTINPNVSKDEIMTFLKEWRSEQVDRLNNELKRLNSIEEFMKNIGKDGNECSQGLSPPLKLKEVESTKSNYSLCQSFIQ